MQFEHENGQDYLVLEPREAQYIDTYADGALAHKSPTTLIDAYEQLFTDHLAEANMRLEQLKDQRRLSYDTVATFMIRRTITLLTDSIGDILEYKWNRYARPYWDHFNEPPLPPPKR